MLAARSAVAWVPLLLLVAGTWLPLMQYGPDWNRVSENRIFPRREASITVAADTKRSYAERYRAHAGSALILDDEIAVRVGSPVAYDWYALRILLDVEHLEIDPLREAIRQRQYSLIVLPPKCHRSLDQADSRGSPGQRLLGPPQRRRGRGVDTG